MPEVTKLLEASNSRNTWNTYQSGISSFVSFKLNQGLRDTWPPRFSELRCLLIKCWECAFNCEGLFIGFKSLVTTESNVGLYPVIHYTKNA